jgi:hypothetical protein
MHSSIDYYQQRTNTVSECQSLSLSLSLSRSLSLSLSLESLSLTLGVFLSSPFARSSASEGEERAVVVSSRARRCPDSSGGAEGLQLSEHLRRRRDLGAAVGDASAAAEGDGAARRGRRHRVVQRLVFEVVAWPDHEDHCV